MMKIKFFSNCKSKRFDIYKETIRKNEQQKQNKTFTSYHRADKDGLCIFDSMITCLARIFKISFVVIDRIKTEHQI